MGYYRPITEFNIGKKQEHADRVFFNEQPTHMSYGDPVQEFKHLKDKDSVGKIG